jgi:NUMOD3 motif
MKNKEKAELKDHFTYVILNTLKPGSYVYTKEKFSITFEFEPIYVGKGVKDRWLYHIKSAKSEICGEKNKHKYYAIKKIINETRKDPIVEIVLQNVTDKESIDFEVFLISLIGRTDLKTGPLLNMTNGGDGLVGRILSEETKRKISIGITGKNNGRYGKKYHASESARKKLSESLKGRISWNSGLTKEVNDTIKRMSDHFKIIRKLPEFRERMSKVHKGQIAWNKGKKYKIKKKWIHNNLLNEEKFVRLDVILENGWENGRSLELKKKISKANKGKIRSEEDRKKSSRPGSQNGMFGKKHTLESRLKISKGLKGKKFSEERRKQTSIIRKGKGNPFYGKHHSKKTLKRLSEKRKAKRYKRKCVDCKEYFLARASHTLRCDSCKATRVLACVK